MTQYIADESKLIRSSLQTPAGRAASFDGVNDYIEVGNIFNPGLGSCSVSMWVNTSGTTVKAILAKNDGGSGVDGRWGMYVDVTTGYPDFFLYVNSLGPFYCRPSFSILDDKWHHLVGVMDRAAGFLRIYVDGKMVASTDISSVAAENVTSTFPIRIGADTHASGRYYNGKLMDVRLYNAVLTAAEIVAMYNATKTSGGNVAGTIYADRLVGWWPLEENATYGVIPWYDISGNQNHGNGAASGVASYSGADIPCSISGELGQSLRADFATGTEVVHSAINDFTNALWVKNALTATNATTLSATLTAGQTGYAYWNNFPSVVGGGYAVGEAFAFEFEARSALASPVKVRVFWSGHAGIRPELRWGASFTTNYVLGSEWQRIRVSCDVARIVAGNYNQVQPIFYIYDNDNGGAGGTYSFECRNVKIFTNVCQLPMLPKATDLSKDVRGAALQYPGPLAKRATMSGSPCATLDGINDFVNLNAVPLSITRSTPYSFSAWVYAAAVAGSHRPIFNWSNSASDRNGLAVTAIGALVGGSYNGSGYDGVASPNGVIVAGSWYHVAYVRNGGSDKVYVNGVDVSITGTAANLSTSQKVLGTTDNGATFWSGRLSDVRFYDEALTAADVATVYDGGLVADKTVYHLPCSDGSGLALRDVVGNSGVAATATGMTSGELWANTQNVYHYGAAYGIRNPIGARRYRTLNGSTQYFEQAADLRNIPATTGLFWVAWYGKINAATSAVQSLVGKWEGSGTAPWLLYRLNTTTMRMAVTYGSPAYTEASAAITDDGLDHLIFGYLDMSARTVGISVDLGAFGTAAFTDPNLPAQQLAKLRVGCSGTSPQYFLNGLVRRVAFGQVTNATTAAAIRAAIYNSASPLLYSQLTDQQRSDWGLLAWYDCDEWGPQLLDRHGANHLNGIALTADYPLPAVPALATEPTRHYGDFAAAYALVGPDDAKFEATAGSMFWVAALVRAHNASSIHAIASKYHTNTEWTLFGNSAVWAMAAVNNVGTVANPLVTLISNEWALLIGYIDSRTDPFQIGLSKNGGAFTTTSLAGTPRTGSDPFAIARYFASNFPDADIAFVATGKAATATFAQIRDALYNSGTPLTYAQLDASQKAAWGLTEWFEVGDYEGTEQLIGKHAATVLTGSCIPSRTTHGGPKKLAPVATAIDFTGGTAAPWTDKQFLGYWTCNGSANGYVVTPAMVGKVTNALSVFARVRNVNTSVSQTFLAADNGAAANRSVFSFYFTDGKLAFYDGSWKVVGSAVAATLSNGNWHDVLYVWSGTSGKIYLDNVLLGETTVGDMAVNAAAWTRASLGSNEDVTALRLSCDIARIVAAAGIRVPGNILSAPNILDVRFDGARCEDHQGRFISYAANSGHTPAKLTVPTAYKHGVILPAGMSKQTNGRSESAFALYSVDQ